MRIGPAEEKKSPPLIQGQLKVPFRSESARMVGSVFRPSFDAGYLFGSGRAVHIMKQCLARRLPIKFSFNLPLFFVFRERHRDQGEGSNFGQPL